MPETSGRARGWVLPATAGVASVAFGVGVGELAAAVLAPSSSPFVVVGSFLIDLAPPWAKDAAIALFGTADKAALLIGIGIVLVAVSGAAGVLEARRPPVGTRPGGAHRRGRRGGGDDPRQRLDARLRPLGHRGDRGDPRTAVPRAAPAGRRMPRRRSDAAPLPVSSADAAPAPAPAPAVSSPEPAPAPADPPTGRRPPPLPHVGGRRGRDRRTRRVRRIRAAGGLARRHRDPRHDHASHADGDARPCRRRRNWTSRASARWSRRTRSSTGSTRRSRCRRSIRRRGACASTAWSTRR